MVRDELQRIPSEIVDAENEIQPPRDARLLIPRRTSRAWAIKGATVANIINYFKQRARAAPP